MRQLESWCTWDLYPWRFLLHSVLLLAPNWVCQETDYKKTNESSPEPPLGGPGDRPHNDRQVLPVPKASGEGFCVFCSVSPGLGVPREDLYYVVWPLVHPEKGLRGRLIFLYVVRLSVLWEGLWHKHQETDYKRTNKSSPRAPFNTPGDRLHKHSRTSLPLGPFSECIRGQTTYKTDKSSPGTILRVSQGTDYTKTKSLPLEPLSKYTKGQTTWNT